MSSTGMEYQDMERKEQRQLKWNVKRQYELNSVTELKLNFQSSNLIG